MKGRRTKVKNYDVENKKENLIKFIKDILQIIDLKAEVKLREDVGQIFIDIEGENLGLLIGKNGKTLEALQLILYLIFNKHNIEKIKVNLDIQSYWKRREERLKKLALDSASKVKETKRVIRLLPMKSKDRRIVHIALRNFSDIRVLSEGDGEERKIVIYPLSLM